MTGLSALSKKILAGNLLFVGCCAAYLAWWSTAFRPGYEAPAGIRETLLVVTGILGIAGLALILEACAQVRGPIRYVRMIAAGGAALIALALITMIGMHRMITTELLLIVFWTCMEICVLGALCGQGVYGRRSMILLCAAVLAAAAVSLVSYMKYYELEPMAAFYDGMVPLVVFGAVTLGISVRPLIGKSEETARPKRK